MLNSTLIASLLVLTAPTSGGTRVQADLADDLTNLASTLPCCEDKSVTARDGTVSVWSWNSDQGEWEIGTARGFARGAALDPPTGEIVLWPEVHGHDPDKPLSEQPDFLAESLRTLAHECQHFKCPPHAGQPPGTDVPDPPANPDDPPTGDGRDPDCNDINYAIHTAAALCAQLTSIADNGGGDRIRWNPGARHGHTARPVRVLRGLEEGVRQDPGALEHRGQCRDGRGVCLWRRRAVGPQGRRGDGRRLQQLSARRVRRTAALPRQQDHPRLQRRVSLRQLKE